MLTTTLLKTTQIPTYLKTTRITQLNPQATKPTKAKQVKHTKPNHQAKQPKNHNSQDTTITQQKNKKQIIQIKQPIQTNNNKRYNKSHLTM